MDTESAVKTLKDCGIDYEIKGSGNVVNTQMPKEGSLIYKKSGKVILYTDGNEEQTSIVPNVIGKTAEEANKIILNSGFNIKINGGGSFNYGQGAIVVSQEYAEGTCLPRGSVITVKILYTDEKD